MFSLIFLGVLTQNVICEFSNVINDPKNAWKTLEKLESIYARVTNVTWPLPAPRKSKRNIEWELDARAAIDGCFCQSTNQSLPGACTADELNEGCKNKISESYAWGVTRTRSSIYWGTIANIVCLSTNTYYVTDNYACLGDGKDLQLPSIYRLDEISGDVISLQSTLTGVDFDRLNSTVGLRAAGNRNGVVILAGLGRSLTSVYFFAFHAESGNFLESMEYTDADDVRKFTEDEKYSLYVGVSKTDGTGDILRYIGSVENPLLFERIASIDGNPAELSFYYDRLVIGTWSTSGNLNSPENIKPCKLLLSPDAVDAMPALNTTQSPTWMTIWTIEDYEADPTIALTYGTSVNVQIDDFLYFGTVQLPFSGYNAITAVYGEPKDTQSLRQTLLFTRRPAALFRGRFIQSTGFSVELLYGDPFLPVYNNFSKSWNFQSNRAPNQFPLFGRAGLGNPYNMYIWSMAVYQPTRSGLPRSLLIGTFDQYDTFNNDSLPILPADPGLFGFLTPVMGADLFIMEIESVSSERAKIEDEEFKMTTDGLCEAEWVSVDGLGNNYNYGIRNLVSKEDLPSQTHHRTAEIVVGTANGYNINPNGGWEVFNLNL